MPLYLITGLSGVGKSTLNLELKARGYKSYDGDKDGFAKWFDDETGLQVDVKREECTPEFLLRHSRNIPREIVEQLAQKAKTENKPIFLCGAHENEDEIHDVFAKIFALVLDEEERTRRLSIRPDDEWGKYPHELEYSLAFKDRWEKFSRRFGYIDIDATQEPGDIVNFILIEIGEH